jgi:hypothetical protein
MYLTNSFYHGNETSLIITVILGCLTFLFFNNAHYLVRYYSKGLRRENKYNMHFMRWIALDDNRITDIKNKKIRQ